MAGWSTVADFAGGEKAGVAAKLTALKDNVVALNGYVVKTADEAVSNSAALQNDNHLSYSIVDTGTFIIDAYLFANGGNAAGDIKVGFSFPTGTLRFSGVGLDIGLASGQVGTISAGAFASTPATSGTSALPYGVSTLDNLIWIHGIFVATATGTLQLMWAQNGTNGTATNVLTGSHMLVQQVA